MVDTETTTTSTGTGRLITFEIDGDELLIIGAGRGELDNRIIFDTLLHVQNQIARRNDRA